jgi:hypothetical protein
MLNKPLTKIQVEKLFSLTFRALGEHKQMEHNALMEASRLKNYNLLQSIEQNLDDLDAINQALCNFVTLAQEKMNQENQLKENKQKEVYIYG